MSAEPPRGRELLDLSVLLPAGWGYDPAGAEGMASATADLIPTGAGTRTHRELSRELDRYGATLSAEANAESLQATLWGPQRQMLRLLPLLGDAVLRPRFDATEVRRIRREMHESQLRELSQPDQRAERELAHRIFPRGHPYRESGTGTRRSLERITTSRLNEFHRRHFGRHDAQFVVTADSAVRATSAALDRVFAAWPRDDAPGTPPIPKTGMGPHSTERIRMPGTGQAELRMGGPSPPRSDPQYSALYLADEILGGRSILARMFQTLREKHGFVYHAGTEMENLRWGGSWQAEAGTDPARVPVVERLMRREVERIGSTAPGTVELRRIRESSLGSLQLHLETTQGAHSLALEVAYHSLADSFYRDWPSVLRAVSPREIRDAARVGLDASTASLVVAGPLPG